MINLRVFKQVLSLIKETDISEVEIEENGEKIKIKRGFGAQPVLSVQPQTVSPVVVDQNTPVEKKLPSDTVEITSPFVGIFYRSGAPGSAPFVEEGGLVKKGDTLCIVEAMKLMNEIESEINGKVVSVLVENGTPVEFGQVLFTVKPLKN